MAVMPDVEVSRVFVVLNPASGNAAVDQVRTALESRFQGSDRILDVHETSEGEDVASTIRAAIGRGFEIVVAAGGDGTVSSVANALIGSEARLGIIPLGTTNVLARELAIPLDIDEACDLLVGPSASARIDAIRIGKSYYFTQVGTGLDALMIRDTKGTAKRLLGSLAYVLTALVRLIGFQPRRFTIIADGVKARHRAKQVLIANCGTLGTSGLKWGPGVCVADGSVDICIIKARNLIHYVSVAWNFMLHRHRRDPWLRYMKAWSTVAIQTTRPLPVQGDGEVIGETPLEMEVVPGALCVVVPAGTGTTLR